MSLPPCHILCQSDPHTQRAVLDALFEPCDTLADILIPTVFGRSFTTYNQLIEACRNQLNKLYLEYVNDRSLKPTIDNIVSAHPRLGPPRDANVKLSSHSSLEQAQLNADPELAQKLVELNDIYEATFQGLRFVVFVNGRSRDEIMKIMKERIARNDMDAEIKEAFDAMCDIALDRAKKNQSKL
ncbi:hypothetical protein KL905_002327 [Ogataea polymorpha]|nr:hypothetical protein KL905_002327 [Ogataea polymorpha]KAG7926667.1 hypothetical protein KL925_002952 [Ogataea polymorpha]